MQYVITLEWKSFQVKVDKIRAYFKTILSSNYDGLICNVENIQIVFFSEISQDDQNAVDAYWEDISSSTFNPTMQEIIESKIKAAIIFGDQMIVDAATENVIQGITQAGKTKVISDYLKNLVRYLREGSLYAAVAELDRLAEEGIPDDMAPWITTVKIATAKTKILRFLTS